MSGPIRCRGLIVVVLMLAAGLSSESRAASPLQLSADGWHSWRVASVTRPVRLLKTFRRVTLAAGEIRELRFELGPGAFTFWNADMQEVIEPGLFDIMVGPNSVDLRSTVLEIA